MRRATEIAADVAAIVKEKRLAYGDSIGTSAAALTLLFPAGIPLDRYDEVLLIVRCWDKLQRIATGAAGQAESPWLDIAGYGICGVAQAEQAEEMKARWQDSVSGPDAQSPSRATPASVEPSTRTPTTPSANEPAVPQPSRPLESLSPQPMDAPAATAQEDVYASVGGRGRKVLEILRSVSPARVNYLYLDRKLRGLNLGAATSAEMRLLERCKLVEFHSGRFNILPEGLTYLAHLETVQHVAEPLAFSDHTTEAG